MSKRDEAVEAVQIAADIHKKEIKKLADSGGADGTELVYVGLNLVGITLCAVAERIARAIEREPFDDAP